MSKKSFILYNDNEELFCALSDEQAGKLIKHIFNYTKDNDAICDDKFVEIAFISIKQQLKRDLQKWDAYVEKQKSNGKLGGRPKKPKETQKTQAFLEKPKKADNVNVNVNANVNVKEDIYMSSEISESAQKQIDTTPIVANSADDEVPKCVNSRTQKKKYYRKFKHLAITEEEFKELTEYGYSKQQIDSVLDDVENYRNNTKYSSLKLTALKWLKKEHGDKTKQEVVNDPFEKLRKLGVK